MREILFRGKRVDNGEWVYGYYIKANHHWHEHGIHEDWIAVDTIQNGGWCNVRGKYAVLPETVGQYTGLTDKNGKKIFEGDIVLFEDESPSNYEYHDCTEMRCGAIEYGDNCFYITDRIAVEMEDLIYDGKLDVEIIGNIHDNPELLGGGYAFW